MTLIRERLILRAINIMMSESVVLLDNFIAKSIRLPQKRQIEQHLAFLDTLNFLKALFKECHDSQRPLETIHQIASLCDSRVFRKDGAVESVEKDSSCLSLLSSSDDFEDG